MAKLVLLTTLLTINSNDLSTWCNKAELPVEVEEKDVTTFASDGWKEHLGGLKVGQLGLEFKQDFAASALDAIMWPLLGTVVPFTLRPSSAAVGAGNPQYGASVLIAAWNPIEGGVGDEATVSVTYPTSGAITRTTS